MPAASATALQWIDRQECLRLLQTDSIGRLAVLDGPAPTILPVNYALDGEDIVFRTDPGLKLDAGPRSRASFEVDAFDRATRSGWSVVVSGRLEEVTRYDAPRWARVQALAVDPWAGGDKSHWMRLVGTKVTGRRLAPAPMAR
jgi:nitroimidazol reductase NimA-like FMN-containing flavoprotein (pyridoxamine 5'-phosphate oxidase superfamily)